MVINAMEKNKERRGIESVGDEGGGNCNFKQDNQEELKEKVTFEQSLTEVGFVYFFKCGFMYLS